ncbi:MAG: DUF92 domain-containing protein [Thermoplasmata archaeon]|nr:DUF92 domain-containing protein [Thermoplasmata archaeon]MCI4359373.1 DUF92 domain-containing protein [Thermoplasmata archaeon]
MVLPFLAAGVGVAATAALSYASVRVEALTPPAGGVAFAFGAVIVILGGFPFLALLVLFVAASVVATRYRIQEKEQRHVQEGRKGERGVSNVVAHILVPTALVLTAWVSPSVLSSANLSILYSSALAFGAADTFASEFGVLAGGARSILTGRRVDAGTNGGVSALGEAWALVGAITTALFAVSFLVAFGMLSAPADRLIAVATASGFLACQVDSVLGEALENRGYLTKGGTNLLSMVSSVWIAGGLLFAFGVA